MVRILTILSWLMLITASEAAIVRVRSSVMVEHSIVTLDDIAEVYEDDDAKLERLKAVTIEPAPVPGAQHRIPLQQIVERLRAHNVNLSTIEFAGRSVVLVGRKPEQTRASVTTTVAPVTTPTTIVTASFEEPQREATPSTPKVLQKASGEDLIPAPAKTDYRYLKLTPQELRDAEQLVYRLVRTYLIEKAPSWGHPRVTVHVPTKLVPKLLDAPANGLRLTQGTKIGDNEFHLVIEITNEYGKTESVEVTATIVRRPKVVVTTRSLPIGHIVTNSDVKLEEVDGVQREATELEQVIGKETRTTLAVGKRVAIDAVSEPKYVHRGDVVKGYVSVGTVRVMQEFKAIQDGRLNEVISMETIVSEEARRTERPQRRVATVVGVKQVEVMDAPEGAVRSGLQIIRTP